MSDSSPKPARATGGTWWHCWLASSAVLEPPSVLPPQARLALDKSAHWYKTEPCSASHCWQASSGTEWAVRGIKDAPLMPYTNQGSAGQARQRFAIEPLSKHHIRQDRPRVLARDEA